MLLHIQNDGTVTPIVGTGHIVISLNDIGKVHLVQAFCRDKPDCEFFTMADSRLIARELPRLLQELRVQIQSAPTTGLNPPRVTAPGGFFLFKGV